MKKSIVIVLIIPLLNGIISAQTIPTDSLYLGQIPPGYNPKKFELYVNPGSFAAERIAVSNDGKEIYYTEIKAYYPISGDTIKYYSYTNNKWVGPYNLFEGYLAPGLSIKNDIMYFQANNTDYESFFAVKKNCEWSPPQRFLNNLSSAHFLQITQKGNYFVSSKAQNGIGGNDWCRLSCVNFDTTAISLEKPLNTEWDNLDFYIGRDESFIIVATIFGLAISYPKSEGGWTSPRNLGDKINFGLASWGPYVTNDKKYLFYTTGTNQDYSDVGIYWVRIENLIDSLKNSNNVPYLKNKIENQAGIVGIPINFTIPENTFIDDDGPTIFIYNATLNTGQPLPVWLRFDSKRRMFYGTPTEKGEFTIIVLLQMIKMQPGWVYLG